MKNIFTTFLLIVIINSGFSQNKNTEKADLLFESYQYVDAIKEYLKLTENKTESPYVYKQLADCYFTIFDNEKALKW